MPREYEHLNPKGDKFKKWRTKVANKNEHNPKACTPAKAKTTAARDRNSHQTARQSKPKANKRKRSEGQHSHAARQKREKGAGRDKWRETQGKKSTGSKQDHQHQGRQQPMLGDKWTQREARSPRIYRYLKIEVLNLTRLFWGVLPWTKPYLQFRYCRTSSHLLAPSGDFFLFRWTDSHKNRTVSGFCTRQHSRGQSAVLLKDWKNDPSQPVEH